MRTIKLQAVLIGVLIFLMDFASKAAIYFYIKPMNFDSLWYPYSGIGIFENFFGIEFSIVHLTNKGAAWGWLADFQFPLLILRMILISAMICYVLFYNQDRSRLFPFTLIIAGALGNVCDYFIYGHVIDMLHFVLWGYDFPAFNVADSAIFIGISWLCLMSFCCSYQSKPNNLKAFSK